jgi:hypothetical protein
VLFDARFRLPSHEPSRLISQQTAVAGSCGGNIDAQRAAIQLI